jgi:hypothetical protein
MSAEAFRRATTTFMPRVRNGTWLFFLTNRVPVWTNTTAAIEDASILKRLYYNLVTNNTKQAVLPMTRHF